ncbi:hypothetical protein M1O19_06230 [Dehalococcoidia bacterium]|nr:hypothetical protein [Dehalococcoidia bacterium]
MLKYSQKRASCQADVVPASAGQALAPTEVGDEKIEGYRAINRPGLDREVGLEQPAVALLQSLKRIPLMVLTTRRSFPLRS